MVSIAILGFGIVGSGVAGVLARNREEIDAAAGEAVRLKYIVDVRDFPDSPFAPLVVKDFTLVERDPDVRVVVETIGGCGVALEFTRRAIMAGKHVVTSNKALVAAHGRELLELAKLYNVNYFFEASVGGGIPVLRPLKFDLAGNRITRIRGILNGTTNFILTQMETGQTYKEALEEAQMLGYAEADPSGDVEGFDTAGKVAILSELIFNTPLKPEDISREGITDITVEDIEDAAENNMRWKLIGSLKKTEKGVEAFVKPMMLPKDNPLAAINGAGNAIQYHTDLLGAITLIGPGAGRKETAAALIEDLLHIVL